MRHSSWALAIGGTTIFLSLYAVNQVQVQRLLTAKYAIIYVIISSRPGGLDTESRDVSSQRSINVHDRFDRPIFHVKVDLP